MKKRFTSTFSKWQICLLGILLITSGAFAQNKQGDTPMPIGVPFGDKAPGITVTTNNTPATPPALWDVEFNYDATTASGGRAGQAGVVFIGHEFWTSQWASDTIMRFSPTGAYRGLFVIPGITGTRSMTYDGTNVYFANNTSTIYRVDTTSKTVIGVINAPITQVRMMTYDPTADAGAGGFWVGNFNTDITQINLSGGVLSTVTVATHGLSGMYGCAFENQTTGSPYLWVFHQGGTSSQAEIARLQLPAGTPTVVSHDVMSDVGAGLTTGLAGGLFITDGLVPGEFTIVGMLQGTPTNQLFGYELNDFIQPPVDAGLDVFEPVSGYSQMPVNHVTNQTYTGTITNYGADPLLTVEMHVEASTGGGLPFFTDVQTATNLAPGASVTLTSLGFTPSAVGTIDINAYTIVTGTQVDTINGNDSSAISFMVTDSTFARDNGIPDGGNGYAVSTTNSAYAVSTFETQVFDTLSSVWIELATPVDGDTTFAVVASTSGGFPDAVIATGRVEIISGASNTYILNFPGGVPLAAGTYAIGCYEGANTTINLAQSNSIYTAGTNFFFTNGLWTQSNIATARFIRPNFGTPVAVNIEGELTEKAVSVFPNPTNGEVFVQLEGVNEDAQIQVMNTLGQTVFTSRVQAGMTTSVVDLSQQEAGMYMVKIISGETTIVKKITLQR